MASSLFSTYQCGRDREQPSSSVMIQFGVDPTEIHVWSQGVDATFSPGGRISARKNLGLSSAGYLLVSVGRIGAVKGLDLLLKACTLLRDRGVESICLIGDVPLVVDCGRIVTLWSFLTDIFYRSQR